MDNLSTATDIGALELGDDLTGCGDGVLETAGASELLGPVTSYSGTCCSRVDDGALESAGVTANGGPTTTGYCPPTRMCR